MSSQSVAMPNPRPSRRPGGGGAGLPNEQPTDDAIRREWLRKVKAMWEKRARRDQPQT